MSFRFVAGALVAAVLAGAVALVGSAPAAAATIAAPQVMAHKGLHYPYEPFPENSTGAVDAASALGVPTEIDVLLSKPTATYPSGVPFVFHDQTLGRMTRRDGNLWDYTPDQLAQTCLVTKPRGATCSDYTIPRLSTVLKRTQAAHGALDIELKTETLTWRQALAIVKRLESADAWTWDVLPGFAHPVIMSRWMQPLTQVQAVAARRGDPPLSIDFQSVRPDYSTGNTAGSAMESVYYRNLTADAVAQLHALNLKVDAYTTNDPASWPVLRDAQVDWVISDDVHGYQTWAASSSS